MLRARRRRVRRVFRRRAVVAPMRRRRRRLLRRGGALAVAVALFTGVLTAGSAPAGAEPAAEAAGSGCGIGRTAGTKTHTVRAAGLTRTYYLTVPQGYTGRRRVPVVIDMHGAGSNAQEEAALTQARAHAAERGWIVATPDAGRRFWLLQAQDGVDITFIQKVVQDVSRRLCIAPGRRFAMGMSNGAAMSATLTCALPDTFAAAASVGGVNIAGTCLERPRPILAVHGTADPIVPYNGGDLGGALSGLLTVPSVPSKMADWSIRNHCDPGTTSVDLTASVKRISYGGCDEPVDLLRVQGGGHTWPGGPNLPGLGPTNHSIDATELIFDFFQATFSPT